MLSTGQKCTATSRAIVHSAIAPKFVERLLALVAALRVGDPLETGVDVGPVVSEAQLARVEGYHAIAEDEGHELALGGRATERPNGGYFVAPTVYWRRPALPNRAGGDLRPRPRSIGGGQPG